MSRIPFRFAPIPDDMLFDPAIPADVIVLWAAIYRLTDRRGVAAISQTELGEALGWSESTLRRTIRKAEECEVIGTTRRGRTLPNTYAALLRGDRSEMTDHSAESDRSPAPNLTGHTSISREVITRETPKAEDGFGEWWLMYPRKVEKADAAKVWKRMTTTDRAAAYAALPAHIAAWKAQHRPKDKLPHPTTWLHGRRWEDDLTGEAGGARPLHAITDDRPYVPPLDAGAQLQAALARLDPEARAAYE